MSPLIRDAFLDPALSLIATLDNYEGPQSDLDHALPFPIVFTSKLDSDVLEALHGSYALKE